jgi:uncharacterized protein
VSEIEKLLRVQELDTEIKSREREQNDIPARKDRELTRLNDNKTAVQAASDTLKALRADLKRLELETQSDREKIAKLRTQQMTLKTNKEFKAMDSEIFTVECHISKLEDEELVVMERIEAARGVLALREGELGSHESEVLEDVAVLDERVARITAELSELRARRKDAVQNIDPAWLQRYEAVLSRRMPAVVPLEDGVCGGCHLKLPPYVLHDTRKRNSMVSCSFCGRILY